MKPVTQEDRFGCGVACVAFILSKEYQEAKKLFDAKRIKEYGCDSPDISNALNSQGLNYKWGKFEGGQIPDNSVVYLGKSDYYNVGHWVVKVGNRWMNPWIKGEPVENAVGGFQKKLPMNNITYIVYPETKERYGKNQKNQSRT